MELKMKHVGLQNPIKNMKASIKMGSKINEKSNKSGWKWYQKSIKNPSKIHQKSMKINENEVHGAVLGWLWRYLGSCWLKVMGCGFILTPIWRILGASWLQEGGSWAVLGSKLGFKMGQNRYQERSEPLSIRWSIWRLIFEAIWSEFGSILDLKTSQNGAKLGAKSIQVWCWFESCFWKDFGIIFCWIWYKT